MTINNRFSQIKLLNGSKGGKNGKCGVAETTKAMNMKFVQKFRFIFDIMITFNTFLKGLHKMFIELPLFNDTIIS